MYLLLILLISFVVSHFTNIQCDPKPGTPTNTPFGEGLGIKPGRVAWAFNRSATTWDGTKNSFWWEMENLDLEAVKMMLKQVILSVADQEDGDLKSAWDKIFRYHNLHKTGKEEGYTPGEKIVTKINLNGNFFTHESNEGNQVSPQFLVSLVDQLVNYAGVQQKDIYFYDASRIITKNFWEGPQGLSSFFPKVNMYENPGAGPCSYTKNVIPDPTSYFEFSNPKIPSQKTTKIPTIVQNADYMIELNDFRGHNGAGFTGSGKNWFGSIYRPDVNCTWPLFTPPPHYNAGHWCPKSLHPFVTPATNPMGSYNPLVDLLGHPKLGQNVLIFLMDGMYGGLEETNKTVHGNDTRFGVSWPIKYAMKPFNNWWTSSVFASLDPIAIDSVQFDFIRNEPNIPWSRDLGCVDNYLHEAAKLPNPPSKTVYNPSGKKPLGNPLGIHEHWNNADEKMYSVNFGKDYGIELVQIR